MASKNSGQMSVKVKDACNSICFVLEKSQVFLFPTVVSFLPISMNIFNFLSHSLYDSNFFVCIALKILHDKLACNLKTDPLVHVQHLTTEFSLYFSKLALSVCLTRGSLYYFSSSAGSY